MKYAWGILPADKVNDPWLKQKCSQITISSLTIAPVLIGANVDEILASVPERVEWLILLKSGCYLDDPGLLVERVLQTEPSIIGHILAYSGEYPFFHDQFLAISLPKWKQLGRPQFCSAGVQKLSCFERSAENFHDDYTPLYLNKKMGFLQTTARLGSEVISRSLESDGSLKNICNEIRPLKLYLYPHHGCELILKQSWKNQLQLPGLHENHKRFFNTYLKPDYCDLTFWPFNTENIIPPDEYSSAGFQNLVTPASGLLSEALIWNSNLHNINSLLFFDINRNQLDFKKMIWNEWSDKVSYSYLVKKFLEEKDLPTSPRISENPQQYDHLYREFDQLRNQVSRIRFLHIDIIEQPEALAQSIEGPSLIHLSNILTFSWNHMRHSWKKISNVLPILDKHLRDSRIDHLFLGDTLPLEWRRLLEESLITLAKPQQESTYPGNQTVT